MSVLADLPIDPNVIIVFAMVIFAGIKALLEKAKGGESGPEPYSEEDDGYLDPYDQYEAELERQRAEMGMDLPSEKKTPPPLQTQPPPAPPIVQSVPAKPLQPTLSAAEKAALENFKRISSPSSKRRSTTSTKARVKRHLASPTAAREALLLAEVLGPPNALKPERRP